MYKKNTKFTRNHISRPFLSRVCRFRLPYLIEIFFISSTFLVGACRFLIIYCWNNDSHLVLIFILLKKFNNSHLIVSCGPAWNSVVGKTLDLALHIYMEVSYSFAWRWWNFWSSEIRRISQKAGKKLLECCRRIEIVIRN